MMTIMEMWNVKRIKKQIQNDDSGDDDGINIRNDAIDNNNNDSDNDEDEVTC